jgi:hypothetical protein
MLIHNLGADKGWTNGGPAKALSITEGNIELEHLSTGEKRFIQPIQDFFYGGVY